LAQKRIGLPKERGGRSISRNPVHERKWKTKEEETAIACGVKMDFDKQAIGPQECFSVKVIEVACGGEDKGGGDGDR